MMERTDAELVAGVRRGDRDAAARLVERYLRPCRTVALSIVRDLPNAEDVSQDAMVYAMERIDDCRDPARFGAWLLQIVRNRARNQLRDSKPGRILSIDSETAASLEPAPDRRAEQAQLRDRLLDALGELTEDRRAVVLLHDLEGWTHVEIAERLAMPPGTVRSHLHHARKKLRQLLQELRE